MSGGGSGENIQISMQDYKVCTCSGYDLWQPDYTQLSSFWSATLLARPAEPKNTTEARPVSKQKHLQQDTRY